MRAWVMEAAATTLNFLFPFYWLALAVAVFILLPLSFWRRTRGKAGLGLVICSYIFGLSTWLLGVAVTFGTFGWFGLILGLLVFGVGVIPLAIIGAIFKLQQFGLAGVVFVMFAVALATRGFGFNAIKKSET